jgi:hypothetical protein
MRANLFANPRVLGAFASELYFAQFAIIFFFQFAREPIRTDG